MASTSENVHNSDLDNCVDDLDLDVISSKCVSDSDTIFNEGKSKICNFFIMINSSIYNHNIIIFIFCFQNLMLNISKNQINII